MEAPCENGTTAIYDLLDQPRVKSDVCNLIIGRPVVFHRHARRGDAHSTVKFIIEKYRLSFSLCYQSESIARARTLWARLLNLLYELIINAHYVRVCMCERVCSFSSHMKQRESTRRRIDIA